MGREDTEELQGAEGMEGSDGSELETSKGLEAH